MRNPFSKDKPTTSTPQASSQNASLATPGSQNFSKPPRVLVIGAGSRGTAYARATRSSTNCPIVSVCEPLPYKRAEFGRRFIWGSNKPLPHQNFDSWRQWVSYEEERREKEKAGEVVEKGVDAVFVCVLDEMHEEVVCGIAHLGVAICCEKPLSTSLESCVKIWRALKGVHSNGGTSGVEGEMNGAVNENGVVERKEMVFAICHVLRYSPYNMALRKLVLEKEIIGDVLSVEHVEPVGNWHFSHSYVRGNWRKESTTAPSLLTKSCHDIDFLMWLLCSPYRSRAEPHFPSLLTSTGSRKYFRKERKPEQAKDATNCLSCPHEQDCAYSAKRVYIDNQLHRGNTGWPVKIVNPEIEEIYRTSGQKAAVSQLLSNLREDYTSETPVSEVEARPWYGRCVYEADNDVCDDQCVTITWDDDPMAQQGDDKLRLKGRGAKTAQFHMVAFTEKICKRRGRIYGTAGEIEYDGTTIKVYDFKTKHAKVHQPQIAQGGHGGGDEGLARQFLMAVEAVDSQGMSVAEAQKQFLGCDLDEAFRSHALVFAAEEARREKRVVDWGQWWGERVEPMLRGR